MTCVILSLMVGVK